MAIVVWWIVAIMWGKLLLANNYQYNKYTWGVFLDEAFPQAQAEYDRKVASGEYIRLVDYSSTGTITVMKEINKQEAKKPAKTSQKNTYLWVWRLSRYYSCDKNQTKWLPFEKHRNYRACMNRQFLWDWDPRTTANGTYLTNEKHANKTVACPRKYMWRTLVIEWYGEYVCNDVWGAIKWHRLDVYAGIWDYAVENWSKVPTGHKKIWLK